MQKLHVVVPVAIATLLFGSAIATAACRPGYQLMPDGTCLKVTIMLPQCPKNSKFVDGLCKCDPLFMSVNGKCIPIPIVCLPPKHLVNGKCV